MASKENYGSVEPLKKSEALINSILTAVKNIQGRFIPESEMESVELALKAIDNDVWELDDSLHSLPPDKPTT